MNNRRALLLKADIKRRLDIYDSIYIEEEMDKHGFEIEDFGKNNELLNSCFYYLLLEKTEKINTISNNIHWILSCIKESEKLSLNDISIMGISNIESLQFCLFSLTKDNIFKDKKKYIQYQNLLNTYKLFSGRDFQHITFSENMNNQFNIIKKINDINTGQFKTLFFKVINDNIKFISDTINIEHKYKILKNILSYEAKNDFFKNVIEIINIAIDISNKESNFIIKGSEVYSNFSKNMIEKNYDKSWDICLKVLIINSKLIDSDTSYLINYFNNNIDKNFKEEDWFLYNLILKNNHLDFPSLYQRKILKNTDTNIEPISLEPFKNKILQDRI